jgi:hypothetical protein
VAGVTKSQHFGYNVSFDIMMKFLGQFRMIKCGGETDNKSKTV